MKMKFCALNSSLFLIRSLMYKIYGQNWGLENILWRVSYFQRCDSITRGIISLCLRNIHLRLTDRNDFETLTINTFLINLIILYSRALSKTRHICWSRLTCHSRSSTRTTGRRQTRHSSSQGLKTKRDWKRNYSIYFLNCNIQTLDLL